MKVKMYLLCLLSLFLVLTSSCSDAPEIEDEDDFISTPLVGLESYSFFSSSDFKSKFAEVMIENENLDGFENTSIIYYDDNQVIFMSINGIFYRYKNNALVMHDIFSRSNANYGSTPGVIFYDSSINTMYFFASFSELLGSDDIGHIYSYNFDSKTFEEVHTELQRMEVIAKNSKGILLEDISHTYYIYNNQFELVETYNDDEYFYLGESTRASQENSKYFLFGKSTNTGCEITIHNGQEVVDTIILDEICQNAYAMDVASGKVYFLIGDTFMALYQFDPIAFEFTYVLEDEKVRHFASSDRIRGLYELNLETRNVCFNNEMDISQTAKFCYGVKAIGDTFYFGESFNTPATGTFDFDDQNILSYTNAYFDAVASGNYLIITKQIITPFRIQDVYYGGYDLIFEDITNFQWINNRYAIFYDQKDEDTFDIVHIDLETMQTQILISLEFGTGLEYFNISPTFVTPYLIYIKDELTNDVHLYDIDGQFIETMHMVGYFQNPIGSGIQLLQRESGEIAVLGSN